MGGGNSSRYIIIGHTSCEFVLNRCDVVLQYVSKIDVVLVTADVAASARSALGSGGAPHARHIIARPYHAD